MKSVKTLFKFFLQVSAIMLGMFEANAQKIRLHALLRGVEIPLKTVRYTGPGIEYDDAREELVISGVEVITRDMIERYKNVAKVVKIGTDVKEIGNFAFSEFTNLKYVYQKYDGPNGGIENHLQLIGVGAFRNCRNLEAIFMVNRCGVTILNDAFMDCESLRWVDLHIRCIVSKAFVHCNHLDASGISGFENIFYIGERAFDDCRNMRDVREKINYGSMIYTWRPIVESIDFGDGTLILTGERFELCDLLPYFWALTNHGWSYFSVVVDEYDKIDGISQISADTWRLGNFEFGMFTKSFYDYINDVYKRTETDSDTGSDYTSPETDSDYE